MKAVDESDTEIIKDENLEMNAITWRKQSISQFTIKKARPHEA